MFEAYTTTVDHGAQKELDDLLLDGNGLCRVVPAGELHRFPHLQLSVWGNRHGLYQYPTVELVEWLSRLVDKPAIEICSGKSIIGHALGIAQTDAGYQAEGSTNPVADRYKIIGAPLMQLPTWVERCEALTAVKKHRPRTVLGCWVTELGHRGKTSAFGVDERKILKLVKRYIMCGNIATHGRKWIIKNKPHSTVSERWLVTRSQYPEQNRIWVWPPLPE